MDLDQCACSGKSLGRLLRPAVLGLLAQEESHGYALAQRLGRSELFAGTPPDISGVYKVLKSMEEEGLVTAYWETGDSGPAKRRYAVTAAGSACLDRWIETLEEYRRHTESLLRILGKRGRKPGA